MFHPYASMNNRMGVLMERGACLALGTTRGDSLYSSPILQRYEYENVSSMFHGQIYELFITGVYYNI